MSYIFHQHAKGVIIEDTTAKQNTAIQGDNEIYMQGPQLHIKYNKGHFQCPKTDVVMGDSSPIQAALPDFLGQIKTLFAQCCAPIIAPCVPAVNFESPFPPDLVVGVPYSWTHTYDSDGIGEVLSQTMPAGITAAYVAPNKIVISGTPTTAGTELTMEYTATNCAGSMLYSNSFNVFAPPNMSAGGSFSTGSVASGGTATGIMLINNVGDYNSFGNITVLITHPIYGTTTFTPPTGVTITDNGNGTSTLTTTNSIVKGLLNGLQIPISYTNDGVHSGIYEVQIDIQNGSGGEVDFTNNQAGFTILVEVPNSDLAASISASSASIYTGGTTTITYTATNVSAKPTVGTNTFYFSKGSNGTLTLGTLPAGWTVTTNNTSVIIIKSSNPIASGQVVTFSGTYLHNGISESGSKSFTFTVNAPNDNVSGNNTATQLVSVTAAPAPDITPILSVSPNPFDSAASGIITISNVGAGSTSGLITVTITKRAYATTTFTIPTGWTLSADTTTSATLQTSNVIPSGGNNQIPFAIAPAGGAGTVSSMTASISTGSGGESNNTNNTHSISITRNT